MATGQMLCVPFPLWISVSRRNRLASQLRSLKVYCLNANLLLLLFSPEQPGKSQEGVEQMTLKAKTTENQQSRSMRKWLLVVIKSIKESSKVRLEVTEKTKSNDNKTQKETS